MIVHMHTETRGMHTMACAAGAGPTRTSLEGVGPPGGSGAAGARTMVDRQAVVRRILGGLLPGGAQVRGGQCGSCESLQPAVLWVWMWV